MISAGRRTGFVYPKSWWDVIKRAKENLSYIENGCCMRGIETGTHTYQEWNADIDAEVKIILFQRQRLWSALFFKVSQL